MTNRDRWAALGASDGIKGNAPGTTDLTRESQDLSLTGMAITTRFDGGKVCPASCLLKRATPAQRSLHS